jgi:hypothetical protein
MARSGATWPADLLTAAESASPVQAVEAVTRELAPALDARRVSFLSPTSAAGRWSG